MLGGRRSRHSGRERVALHLPEATLLLGRDELRHRRLRDVAEPVVLLHEVVARAGVTGLLEREARAAGLGVDARRGRLPAQFAQVREARSPFIVVLPMRCDRSVILEG
jgi:hypothetical protein